MKRQYTAQPPFAAGGRVDFHTHILPRMDDGSQSVEESVAMLRTLSASGVTCVVFTPHFCPEQDSPEAFLARRDAAFDALCGALTDADFPVPEMILGAEIEYFEGVSDIRNYPALSIGKSGCVLLEMPHGRWSSYVVEDILDLASDYRFRVILAHVERYLFDQPADVVAALLDNGVLMQSNAAFFLNRRTTGKAIRFLKRGLIHLLGSDAHNTTVRPPDLGEACDLIEARAGKEIVQGVMQGARYLLRADLSFVTPDAQPVEL